MVVEAVVVPVLLDLLEELEMVGVGVVSVEILQSLQIMETLGSHQQEDGLLVEAEEESTVAMLVALVVVVMLLAQDWSI